jgi:putative transposase
MAESLIGLYKAELIHNETQGPWRTVEDVELATLGWVHWWNTARLLEPIGYLPPDEFEAKWLEDRENQPAGGPQSHDLNQGGINTPAESHPDSLLAGVEST